MNMQQKNQENKVLFFFNFEVQMPPILEWPIYDFTINTCLCCCDSCVNTSSTWIRNSVVLPIFSIYTVNHNEPHLEIRDTNTICLSKCDQDCRGNSLNIYSLMSLEHFLFFTLFFITSIKSIKFIWKFVRNSRFFDKLNPDWCKCIIKIKINLNNLQTSIPSVK